MLVVGRQLGVAVTVGVPVPSAPLRLVGPGPLDGDEEGEREGRELADGPRHRSAVALVGQRVVDPGQVDRREEVWSQHGRAADHRDAEERVEGDRREQHDEPQGRAPLRRAGVRADEHPGEEVARDEEVRGHDEVPGVGRQGQVEQVRPVEDDEAHEEERRREDGVADDLEVRRVDEAQEELAGTEGPVQPGPEAAQREGHRGAEHQEDRHDHGLDHVESHVPGEGDPPVDPERAVRRPDEDEPARDPAHGAQHRPPVPSAGQSDHTGEVEADREQRRGEEEPLDPPGGHPGEGGGGRRLGEAGQREGGTGVGDGLGDGRLGPGQGRGEAERHTHDDDLADRQTEEGPARTGLGALPLEGTDRDAPVPPAREAEHDERPGLEQHEDAVGGRQVLQSGEPRRGGHHPGDAQRHEGPERHGRVAPGHHGEGITKGPPQQDEGEQTTGPEGGAEQVHREGVDRGLVVRGPAGVAGQSEHDDAEDGEDHQRHSRRPGATERGEGGDDEGRHRRDRPDPQRVDRPHGAEQLGSEGRVVEREPRRIGEREDHTDRAGARPDERRRRRDPEGRGPPGLLERRRRGPRGTGDHRRGQQQRAHGEGRRDVMDDPDQGQGPAHHGTRVGEAGGWRRDGAAEDCGEHAGGESGHDGEGDGPRQRGTTHGDVTGG